MTESKKGKISDATELIRRGATLLKEACPNCGGLQIKYKNRILCINCNDLSHISSIEISNISELTTNLEELALIKIQRLYDALSKEEDLDKQARIANLILLYMDIIERIKKTK
ncbi:MAG: Sjogren's syndrome/scleroderma autoantigen 1 family protein [Nitrososphaerales archaeon]